MSDRRQLELLLDQADRELKAARRSAKLISGDEFAARDTVGDLQRVAAICVEAASFAALSGVEARL